MIRNSKEGLTSPIIFEPDVALSHEDHTDIVVDVLKLKKSIYLLIISSINGIALNQTRICIINHWTKLKMEFLVY